MKTILQRYGGTASVILAGVLWGIISLFVRGLSDEGLDSLQMMLLRAWLSVFLLFFYLVFRKPSLLRISVRDLWMFFGTGILSLTFFSWCYFTTIKGLGASAAVVLLYTSPIFVMLFSAVLFHERINTLKVLALILTFTGCILVTGLGFGEAVLSPLSFFIGLGSGLGYGLYSVFARIALQKYHTLTVIFYTFLFSGISMLFLCNPFQLFRQMTPPAWSSAFAIAFLCTVLPYLLYTFGLGKMETGRAAILVTVEPLVGALLGICVYGESHSPIKLLGIGLIFSAVIVLNKPEHNHSVAGKHGI